MNFLITGVAGFLGSHLAEKLSNMKYKVVGIKATAFTLPRYGSVSEMLTDSPSLPVLSKKYPHQSPHVSE